MEFFEDAERPDLAEIEVAAPEGYIAHEILPIIPTVDQTGTVYFMAAVADVAAQTGRVAGAAVATATRIATSNTTFTTAEAIQDGLITSDELKQMGGLENAARVGAKFAKRSVMAYRETDVAGLILQTGAAADAAFDPARIQEDVQDALDAMELYEGRSVLVASTKVLRTMQRLICADGTYGPMIVRLVGAAGGAAGLAQAGLAEWKSALAAWLGIDEVKAGTDVVWNATAIRGRFALCKLDGDPDPLAHKYRAVLGRTWQYKPDGGSPWFVRTIPDTIHEDNIVRAKARYDAILLNAAAAYVWDGVTE